jgi:adenylylsulfate kinase
MGVASIDEQGFVLWLTGLPCSGKSTIAEQLAAELTRRGCRTQVLDGDVVRQHLSQGLGYSRQDRHTNILRIAFVADLLATHGVIVIVAVVSPFQAARQEARARTRAFFEVHVDCPLGECERRDVKGMYALARAGQIQEFTGIDSPYEVPQSPDLRVNTLETGLHQCVGSILSKLEERRWL